MDKMARHDFGESIRARKRQLAFAAVDRQYSLDPTLLTRFGEKGRLKSQQDAEHNVETLAEALAIGDDRVFLSYISWLKGVLVAAKLSSKDIVVHLECLRDVFVAEFPMDNASLACACLSKAILKLTQDEKAES